VLEAKLEASERKENKQRAELEDCSKKLREVITIKTIIPAYYYYYYY